MTIELTENEIANLISILEDAICYYEDEKLKFVKGDRYDDAVIGIEKALEFIERLRDDNRS